MNSDQQLLILALFAALTFAGILLDGFTKNGK
jgi:hypothetical protein